MIMAPERAEELLLRINQNDLEINPITITEKNHVKKVQRFLPQEWGNFVISLHAIARHRIFKNEKDNRALRNIINSL